MDTISLFGKTYPVEINMRVIDGYLRGVSSDSIASLESGYPSDNLLMLYLALTEGAALAGTDLDITPETLVTLHLSEYNAAMEEFLPIVREQLSPKLPGDPDDGKKKVEKN